MWRLRICYHFREIFQFLDFMNTLRNFAKSVLLVFSRNLHISRKKFILTESPGHMLLNDI